MRLEEINYENPELDRGDLVIFRGNGQWIKIWIVKSSYIDHNTDYSWNYIMVGRDRKGEEKMEDIYTPDILYKISGEMGELSKDIENNIISDIN